ncbi:ATP-binding protein [Kitasatospora sp. NPDC092286]|uniref:ATP-binding protein n=1 Tax=Kitasatospora sp. NPDC092286 TaxID=3364087 RepID=UPI0037F3F026
MFEMPARRASVGEARNRLLRDLSTLAGIVMDDDERYTLRLCSTELLGNAIKHGVTDEPSDGNAQVLVEASVDEGRIRITVSDCGRGPSGPTVRDKNLTAAGGRGLSIVRDWADTLGWVARTNEAGAVIGRDVWFEMTVASLARSGHATAEAEAQPEAIADLDHLSRRKRIRHRTAAMTAASALHHARPTVRLDTLSARSRLPAVTSRTAA